MGRTSAAAQKAGSTPKPPQKAGDTPKPPQKAGGTPKPPQKAGDTPKPPQKAGGTPKPPSGNGELPPERGRCRQVLMLVARWLGWLAAAAGMVEVLRTAYRIRLFAIENYGPVIHEFDPWFNFRATEFLAERGWKAFFTWFDHTAWYPLGRPVATTIYPGMQVASVAIWRALELVGRPWSLNDVCCYVPAWFGAAASAFTALLAHEGMYEVSGGSGAALVAAGAIMAILPAHAKRSVGGGFDNESVAMTPMCAAFYFWVRCLRGPSSWPFAVLAGIAYACMAASWGGYVFVINVIGLHVAVLLFLGYDLLKLHRTYTTFFVVGTACAMQVPVVGWTPLTSMEQLGPLALCILLQGLVVVRLLGGSKLRGFGQNLFTVYVLAGVGVAVVALLIPTGYFAPLSGRVRALFGASATSTGNPLVDSVTEHRPSSPQAYWTYLHYAGYVALAGPAALLCQSRWPSEAAVFVLVLGVATQFFSLKMSRLMILMGPSCSALAGAALGFTFDVGVSPIWRTIEGPSQLELEGTRMRFFNSMPLRIVRLGAAAVACWHAFPYAKDFYETSLHTVRWSLSHPQIMTKNKNGEIVDDIREAYWWLRDNTPEDARILAWWDYGYQISGIANRTTLADGNTWNMEHIGLIGMAFSAPLPEGHRIARHLADYVLFWKEDVGKSTHFAKIANSAFPGHCEEIRCDQYGIFKNGSPTPMMRDSLTWYINRPGSGGFDKSIGDTLYKEVYVSSHGRVRIAKILQVSEESRLWSANPQNRQCDAPGSWYCPGQYPPLLRQLMGWEEAKDNREAALHRLEYKYRIEEQAAAAPGPNGPGIPEGSYLDSCKGCQLEDGGATLHCSRCTSPGHAASASRLTIGTCPAGGLVDNIHGDLQCKPEPNAPDIPPGGYANSCLGCKLDDDGSTLRCSHCGTADGHRRAASIDLGRCPAKFGIDNADGHLVCIGIPSASGIPPGGYLGSCQGCGLEEGGALLRCSHCMTAAKQQVEATFAMADCPNPGKLDNADGRLICTGIPHSPDVPQGGYLESCHGCRFEAGGQLVCLGCRSADGRWLRAHLDDSEHCRAPSKIDNSDGKLVCVGR